MQYQDAMNQPGVVLIEFYASWCPHCKRMMPIVEQVKELVAGKAKVYQYDIDACREASDEAGVESIPTFIIYRDGAEVWRHTGEIAGDLLLTQIESADR